MTSFVAIVLKDPIMKDGKDKLILIFGLIIAFLLSTLFLYIIGAGCDLMVRRKGNRLQMQPKHQFINDMGGEYGYPKKIASYWPNKQSYE